MNSKYILFDFDGVIIDSFEIAYETSKLNSPTLTEDDYRKAFEGNINDWKDKDFKKAPAVDFFAEYIPRLMKARLFPGIETAIKELAETYRLIIISSTISAPINELLKKFGLFPFFAETFGNDVSGSKVEKIKMVFDKYKATPQDCVFVTDTLGDMREAEKTGVGAIGVSWGFHDQATLRRGNPFTIVASPAELPSAISKYFQK